MWDIRAHHSHGTTRATSPGHGVAAHRLTANPYEESAHPEPAEQAENHHLARWNLIVFSYYQSHSEGNLWL